MGIGRDQGKIQHQGVTHSDQTLWLVSASCFLASLSHAFVYKSIKGSIHRLSQSPQDSVTCPPHPHLWRTHHIPTLTARVWPLGWVECL